MILRRVSTSDAVWNLPPSIFLAASIILSILASLIPLILLSSFRGLSSLRINPSHSLPHHHSAHRAQPRTLEFRDVSRVDSFVLEVIDRMTLKLLIVLISLQVSCLALHLKFNYYTHPSLKHSPLLFSFFN